jgi:hypothetical protein
MRSLQKTVLSVLVLVHISAARQALPVDDGIVIVMEKRQGEIDKKKLKK